MPFICVPFRESQDLVTADIVPNEFPDLADRYDVHDVPRVVVNESAGAQPEARLSNTSCAPQPDGHFSARRPAGMT
jgi:hypothetical protein